MSEQQEDSAAERNTPNPARPGAKLPVKRMSVKQAFAMLLPPLLGAGVGYGIARLAVEPPFMREALQTLSRWDLLILPFAILLVLAVHEMGHLLGGFSRGMRFLLFVVGPLQWSRSANGVQFNWVFNMGTFGGLAACTPNPDRSLRSQMLPMAVGGPAASLLLAALGLGLSLIADGRWSAWGLIIGLLSGLIFLVTALPMRAGNFMSDGAQLLEILRGGSAVESRHRLSILMGQSLTGLRPSEWDGELLDAALDANDPEALRRISLHYLALLRELDLGRFDAAEKHAEALAQGFDDYPKGFRQSLAVELIIYHGLYRNDLDAAREWATFSKGGVVDQARRKLAEALLEAKSDVRSRLLEEARTRLRRSMDPGVSRLTSDQIEMLAARSNEVAASAATS